MKKFLLAGTALIGLVGAASAADMAVKAPVYRAAPVAAWSWSGFYIGINGGYSVGTDEYTQSHTFPGFPGFVVFAPLSNTIAPKGGLFGGQAGFNLQTGPIVLGVEGDWQLAD